MVGSTHELVRPVQRDLTLCQWPLKGEEKRLAHHKLNPSLPLQQVILTFYLTLSSFDSLPPFSTFLRKICQLIASLTADPGVMSSILPRTHTFVEIDREIFSMVILLPGLQIYGGPRVIVP